MAKQKYALNRGEKIVFKVSDVRHGFWSSYSHALTITTHSVILEKYGMLDNFKGIERFNYADISQAIIGEASNGEKQLELYMGNRVEDFALQSDDDNELKILLMAINDQMSDDAPKHNFNYYQELVDEAKDIDRIMELRSKSTGAKAETVSGLDLAEAVVKNVIKSGDFSAKGLAKGMAGLAKSFGPMAIAPPRLCFPFSVILFLNVSHLCPTLSVAP